VTDITVLFKQLEWYERCSAQSSEVVASRLTGAIGLGAAGGPFRLISAARVFITAIDLEARTED
jgi:hypothetical protein